MVDSILDTLRLVFLLKIPLFIGMEPQNVLLMLKMGWAIVLSASIVHGSKMWLLVAVCVGLIIEIAGDNNTFLVIILLLLSPFAVLEGTFFGSGMVNTVRREPRRLLLAIGVGISFLLVLLIASSIASTLTYLILVLVMSSIDIFQNLTEEEKRKGGLFAILYTSFLVWIILTISLLDTAGLNDTEKLIHTIAIWIIRVGFLGGIVNGATAPADVTRRPPPYRSRKWQTGEPWQQRRMR